MIDAMLKDSKKEKKNGSNGVPTPSGGTQPHIKSECPTPDPLAANAGTTVPSVTVKDEPSTPNGGESMNNCENSGSNNCATLSGQSGNTSSGPQPTSGPDIKPNVCGPGGGMNPMMGPNNVGSNPMDNFLNDPPMDMKSGGGDLGSENCGPMMGQIKMEDQQLGPGHDFVGMGDPMGGNMNPMMGGPGMDMAVHKQPSTLDAQYMQQQSQIFVFSTQLANEAAEAVIHGQCPSIIAYHCGQPGTKKFLEHPLKINQFSKNSSQILTQLAMKKGPPIGRGMGFGGPNMMGGGGSNMIGDFMGPGGPNGPMGPSMGPGMGNWNQNNCDSMPSGMGPMSHGGPMGPRMGMPGGMGPGMMPCCSAPHGNMVPCGPGSGPPCSQSGSMGMHNKPQMDGNMMSPLPAGSPMMQGSGQNRQVPISMSGMMGPGGMQMGPNASGMNKDLLGVKVPDENLTPQQMQHRAEKLAKMKLMKQMLFPEQGPGGPDMMGQMNPGSGNSPCPPGGPMMGGPGMMNPMNQGSGPMGQGGGPMMMPMMGNKMMGPCNIGPDGPNMMPSSGMNSSSAQMEWQKLQAQFFDEQRKKKGPGPSPGMMMSSMGPMGQGGMSPMQMGSPSGHMGMMGHGNMNMGMMGPMNGPRMGGGPGVRMQGPPPPYPQGQRSASASGGPMPSPLQSQGPPSPPLSLPSPRNAGNMESPADRGYNQRLSGNMGPASVPGPSPSGILNTPLDSPNPSANQPRPMGNVSNPGTPVTGPGPPHVSPGMRKDNMVPDFSNSMTGMMGGMNNSGNNPGGEIFGRPMPPFSQGQTLNQGQNTSNQQKCQNTTPTGTKEPNLMPVPSPQQIQYFEGQELTIQKQPNTSLRETDLLSPSMPVSSMDSGLPSSSEMQCGPRMSGGPNTPTTPSSTADNPPPRYPGSQAPHTPNGNFPAPSPGGQPTSQVNSNQSSDNKNQRFAGPSPQVPSGPKTPVSESVQPSDNNVNKFSASNSPNSANQNMESDFARFTSQSSNQSQNRISTSPLFDVSPPKMSDIGGFGGPPDNVPINPMSGPMGSKMFDPISSMAQMSQQLTNTVGPAIGPSSPPLITSMAPTNQSMSFSSGGSGGMGMPNQMGVGMVNFNTSLASMQGMQQMGDGPMMGSGPNAAQTVNNTYVSATMNIQQMNIQSMHGGGAYNPMMQGPPNPMMSGDPSMMKSGMPQNPMMMGGPQRSIGPGGPYPQMGPGGPQQMMGPGPMVSQRMMGHNASMNRPTGAKGVPFNGANVQVIPSAPNTIQYLPSRPQTVNSSPRGPPRLDFLPTFSGPMDSKSGGPQGMQYFTGGPNSSSTSGMPMGMMGPNGPGNQNMSSGGPMNMSGGMPMPNMGGPNHMMGMNGPMGNPGPGGNGPIGSMPMGSMMGGPGGGGMGPGGPMGMSMPTGPMGPGPNMNMMPSGMSMNMSSQGMSMGGGRGPNPGQMMRPQQMGGMYQGPGGPMSNDAMFMAGGGGPMPINPGGNNPMMMSSSGGFSGGKQSQMGPDPSQPMNGPQFKGSYMGPSAADPNYAQQFHNFQQQLYATNSRNQMGNPNMGMAGQSFFGPK
ncbi:protein BCL9 homolog isoform X2 [Artemia franciscana]|uniref:B-cell lymphoma 9 beta-catenin binding domain-containing protein n=1 Tax=Artemia franciscana TaxID=6661 RepID=A0AA88HAN2_ARTSF|nr:hypothetical protein QYM36_017390 [Artemia franciscana]